MGITKSTQNLASLPLLGVGIIYSPTVLSIDFPKGLINTLEIEPQTLCVRDTNDQLKIPITVFEEINKLPYHKLVHSIGAPVAGSRMPEQDQLTLINYATQLFDSPWVTEHLSFNATTEFNTGFFLPPCQTRKGLELTIDNIRYLQQQISRPIAIETGVNYLKPNNLEMNDGAFVSHLCKETGCGILLDIHNIFANQLNGRQSIEEFLKEIPLDHVVEMHIAGGTELNDLWMDSHSGPIDKRLLALTKEILPELRNLKAITYEVFDSYIPVAGDAVIISEMEKVKRLWDDRAIPYTISKEEQMPRGVQNIQILNKEFEPKAWEELLGHQVISVEVNGTMGIQSDRIAVYQKLIKEFRASMVARVFKLTTRYMMLVLGMKIFAALLNDFWKHKPPEQLSHKEAINFAHYLENKNYKLPWLDRLLAYEVAILQTLLDDTKRIVDFDVDPTPMFKALSQGKLPENRGALGKYEIEITPDANTMDWMILEA
ncbi:DUF692 family protein [Aquimarina sp. U1-2]|uniref:DUF692 domain-containing protein n=1 Tax=Aquimarina sp. U1-2 TaxID=2823141 RepID=UPI001AEC8A5A|nr:DUF692 family multinuclear iron-containing protein [Aquimarina sp. U1-2]MBP2831941.1 DUF692 family protein [Aquimarina sp. U1-2]